jgi:hypothetical protein
VKSIRTILPSKLSILPVPSMPVRRWIGAGLRNVEARIRHMWALSPPIQAARAGAAVTPVHHHIPAGLLRFRTIRGPRQAAAVMVVAVAVAAAAVVVVAPPSINDRTLVTPKARCEATPHRPRCQTWATRSTSLAVSERGGRSSAAIRPRSSVGGLTWARGRFPFPLSTDCLSHLRHGGFPAATQPCHGGHRPGRLSDGGKIVFRSHSTFAKSKTFLLPLP